MTNAGSLPLFLFGCSDPALESVKNTYFDSNRTLTNSNIFDNREYCDSREWSTFTDDKNRNIIQFLCEVSDSEDPYRQKRINIVEARAHINYTIKIEHAEEAILLFKSRLKDEKELAKELAKELQSAIGEKRTIEFNEQRLESTKREISTLENKIKEYQAEIDLLLKNQSSAIAEYQSEVDLKYPETEALFERYQWVVNKDNEARLIYGDFFTILDSGEEQIIKKTSKRSSLFTRCL